VLYHYGYIGFDHAPVLGIRRYGLRVLQPGASSARIESMAKRSRPRASGLASQAVALLFYLLYELVVGVDELLHALLLQHLHYLVVVHAGLL
jgi:hypothetical protein